LLSATINAAVARSPQQSEDAILSLSLTRNCFEADLDGSPAMPIHCLNPALAFGVINVFAVDSKIAPSIEQL
jgi:hypothetical protein